MALYEKLEADFQFSDERGKLVQLIHDGYRQVNILESKKGVVRGGHYHKIAREAFFVLKGSVEVFFQQGGKQEKELFCEGSFFSVKPYVVHSMRFCEDCFMVALYDVPIETDQGEKDIYTEMPEK